MLLKRILNSQGYSFLIRTKKTDQTDIGLQLGKACILVVGKGRGGIFYFFCFLSFIPVPLSSLFLSFISSTISSISFLPFSGRRHKMTHKGWRVVKPQHKWSDCADAQADLSFFGYTCLVIFPQFVGHIMIYEPAYDKTNKMTCAQSSLRSMGSLRPKLSSSGQRRLWSDCTDIQVYLSLRWAHLSFCWFLSFAGSYPRYTWCTFMPDLAV